MSMGGLTNRDVFLTNIDIVMTYFEQQLNNYDVCVEDKPFQDANNELCCDISTMTSEDFQKIAKDQNGGYGSTGSK